MRRSRRIVFENDDHRKAIASLITLMHRDNVVEIGMDEFTIGSTEVVYETLKQHQRVDIKSRWDFCNGHNFMIPHRVVKSLLKDRLSNPNNIDELLKLDILKMIDSHFYKSGEEALFEIKYPEKYTYSQVLGMLFELFAGMLDTYFLPVKADEYNFIIYACGRTMRNNKNGTGYGIVRFTR